jgi:hypothetical protein
MLRAMSRSWSSSASNRVRDSRQTIMSVSATTVAVRGESVRSAISPKTSPRAEGRDGRPSRAVGGGLSNDAGAHGRPPILDHVEAVGAVALPHDDLARGEALLLELARQARAFEPTEVGEEGVRASAAAESSRVVHEWSGTGYLRRRPGEV